MIQSKISPQQSSNIRVRQVNQQYQDEGNVVKSTSPFQYNYSQGYQAQKQTDNLYNYADRDSAKKDYNYSSSASNSTSSSTNSSSNSSKSSLALSKPSTSSQLNSESSKNISMTTSTSSMIKSSTSKKTYSRKCGLDNIGNTCYMNSALQCLFTIPGFIEIFISGAYDKYLGRENEGLAKSFAQLATKIDQNIKNQSVSPSSLKRALCKLNNNILTSIFMLMICLEKTNNQFSGSYQQDSHEFLTSFLDSLHNELNLIKGKKPYKELDADPKKKKLEDIGNEWFKYFLERDNSIVTDYFTGQLMSKVKCTICSNESIAFDNFMDLSVSFNAAFRIIEQYDLNRLISQFLKEETLDDTYYCKQCKKHTRSKRQLYLWRVPKILVICIKRFHFGTYKKEKLNHRVQFPVTGFDTKEFNNISKEANCVYDLIGVVNHFGTMHGGHYYSQCKNPIDGTWNEFDDESCTEIDIDTLGYENEGSSKPYVLFYQKREGKDISRPK